MKAYKTHAQYIAAAPGNVQPILRRIQALVREKLPDASGCISYNLPAFRTSKVFFYFAAFRTHIGVYPPVTKNAALIRVLAPYRNEKGNLRFPLSEPIPYELIGRVAVALAREYAPK